ncbi:MAG: YIP1 family protein [Gemmatimonadota bacterium]|nr:YIP1 family protein [Gemmatimonadota bacterium]
MTETTSESSASPVVEAPPLPALPVRLVQVFTSPARLFDALAATPRWVGALVTVVALGLVVQALIPADMLRELMMAGLPRDATPEQIAAAERGVEIGMNVRWVGTVLFPPLLVLLAAGYVLLVWNTLLGGDAGFRPIFASASHAYVIWAFGGLLTLPLVLASGDPRTAFALHLLVPFLEPDGYAFRFLRGLNVFGLWTMIVLGVAVSRLYPRRSAGGAAAVLVLTYVLLKAVGAILAPA